MMARQRPAAGAPRRPANAARAVAGLAAALAGAAAADGSALLVNKLLTDGAAMAAAWAVMRLLAWTARGLCRAARTAFPA